MKLLIITHELVGPRMAGPAIRCWELARALACPAGYVADASATPSPSATRDVEVTLTSQYPVERAHPDFTVTSFEHDGRRLLEQAGAADILLVQGLMLAGHPGLAALGKYLVVDLYDPFVFESYDYFASQGARRDATYREVLAVLDQQMLLGDFFLCASERQRDMWLGRFCALGRLGPAWVAGDPAAERAIAVVPFGLPPEPPTAGAPALKGVRPGIARDDLLLLWGGGIWNWFDAPVVIEAVARVADGRPRVKLAFMGSRHPHPELPEMAMAARARAVAAELGVLDRHVFFHEGWVPYDERGAQLREADAGVSAHFDTVETRFAFRTRMLDYLWAGLPVLATGGDVLGELCAREGAGVALGYGDVAGWAAAITRLHDDPAHAAALRAGARALAPRFSWVRVAAPLQAYCQAPYRLAPAPGPPPPPPLVAKGLAALREGGPRELARRGWRYALKRVRR